MSDTADSFHLRLREFRRSRGFESARSFAAAVGVLENRYARYERGEAEPDLGLIEKFCRTLEITPDQLFGWHPEPPATTKVFAPNEVNGGPRLTEFDLSTLIAGLCWRTAEQIAQLARVPVTMAMTMPLDHLRITARIFERLQRAPICDVVRLAMGQELIPGPPPGLSQQDAEADHSTRSKPNGI